MRLGLYGGAFNPIHRCHLIVAEAARERLGLDRVLFIPTGDAPHKSSAQLMPAVHRLEMVKRAIAGRPYFQVSDIETQRQGTSYTIDTIRALKPRYPVDTTFVFIIGLDAFLDLASWKDPQVLLTACDFAVVSRPGTLFATLKELSVLMIDDTKPLERLDRSELTQTQFALPGGRTLWAIAIPPCEISAKDIRRRLEQGQSLEDTLPEAVRSYILQFISQQGGSPL